MDNQRIPNVQQGPAQGGSQNQFTNSNSPYHHIPEQRQEVRNLMNDLQGPPEVAEQQHAEPSYIGQGGENHNQNPILNQQWGEQLHQQPSLIPTPVVNTQVGDSVNQITGPNGMTEINMEAAMNQRRIEESREENQVQQGSASTATGAHLNRIDPATS